MALVQARLGSTRLPGKALLDLCGHPVLHWVLARTARARTLDTVVLATSTAPRDDALAALAGALDIACHRGCEDDVLARFADAAVAHGAAVVVRVCADNPLIAPEEIDRLVCCYQDARAAGAGADRLYVFNNVPALGSNYADGLGAEAFSAEILHHLNATATRPADREHVTAHILDHPELYDIRTIVAPLALAHPHVKLDIDTPADLDYLRRLCRDLSLTSSSAEVVSAALAMQKVVPP